MSDEQQAALPSPLLSALEARVLGCLVEKAATTPEVYPLTLNAAQLAVNQKTNREPVMNAELGAVGQALRTLEDKRLARVVHGARALRYEHTIDTALNLTTRSRAVVAALLLRGPQTQAELFTRTARMADFPDNDILGDTLDRLIAREPALVVRIGRGPGQREDRYMHLLCGPASVDDLAPARAGESGRRGGAAADDDRYTELEARIAALEHTVAELRRHLAHSDDARPPHADFIAET
jgi:uncharacterized protein YceH (UPF0502 family)